MQFRKLFFILTIVFCFPLLLWAQDDYHTNLQNSLQDTYGLPAGSWVFHDSEASNLQADFTYGDITVNEEILNDQLFSNSINITVNAGGNNPWDAAYGLQNVQSISSGDACLLVVWLKALAGSASVSLFVENASTFEKEVFLNLDLTEEWTPFLVPFEANQIYAPGALTTGLHLAWQAQSLAMGGLTMLNYGTSVSVEDLPNQTNADQYGGWEPDAPWRNEAADRIESIRKANLTVRVEDADGNPIPDAAVEVKMLAHDFAFGSAVVSRLFAGNNSQNDTYESKILDLDGEGHGFNWVVFENALKWPGWEQNWITSKPETANAVQWLRDQDIIIRGHTLVWPGWSNLPPDLEDNQTDLGYIQTRFNEHIEEIVTYPGMEGNIAEWDVLNEITTNRDLEYAFEGNPGYPTGREVYKEIFDQLAAVDPDTKTYINDYVTISQANTGGGLYDLKKQFIQEVIDAGVTLDGIGFQGHIGAFPTSIYEVRSILDDFYDTFGLTAKITEYDTNEAMSDELAATYLRDFLTMVFSHESTSGFLMWGFWDGAHWHDNAPLFNLDWTLKPAGQTFIDMVFDEWWTEESGSTNSDGEFLVRGFKGKYQITIDCGDMVLTDTIELLNDVLIIKSEDEISTHTSEQFQTGIQIFPNPTRDVIQITKSVEKEVEVQLFDSYGQSLFRQRWLGQELTLPLNLEPGVYNLMVSDGEDSMLEKVIVY